LVLGVPYIGMVDNNQYQISEINSRN
jgi:hypothetical protein